MPFITEEIWQQLPQRKEKESVMVAEFPKPDDRYGDEEVADTMQLVIEVITALRNIRGEMSLPPGEQIVALLRAKSETAGKRLRENKLSIRTLARVKELKVGQDLGKPLYSAFVVVREVEIFVPMDRSRMEEEMRRLQKEILKTEKEIAFVGKKLSNEQFVAKAPPEVVQEMREKASQHQGVRKRLEESLRKIEEALGDRV
jgi:valyl-tRNA synthetase